MGVGIGVSTILLALAYGILWQPLPYPEPDRLVRIFDTNPQAGVDHSGVASGNIQDWRTVPSLEGVAGYYVMGRTLSTDQTSEVLTTAQVSADFFPLMRVAPLLGRTFTADDTLRGEFSSASAPIGPDPVVILSAGIWRRFFNADPAIVGTTVVLERRSFTIVGVVPDAFDMPASDVELWIPWNLTGDRPRDQHYLGAVARLVPDASLDQAQAELSGVARALAAQYPSTNEGWDVRLVSLQTEIVGNTAGVLWLLLGAVGLVLVVACANVALLSLMRGLDRSEDTALRRALGASSGRLMREFFLESMILSVLGGAFGVAIATAGLQILPALSLDLPRLSEVSLDYRALLFSAGVTTLSALLAGLPQAWRRSRLTQSANLLGAATKATGGRRQHLLRDTIVVSQVAMAVVLLAGAGLLVRSLMALRHVDPGFESQGVLVAPVFLDSQRYSGGERARAYYAELFSRLAAVPGVTAVGGATTVPTSPLGPDFERPVWPEGADIDSALRMPASVRMVTPGYFSALSLRVTTGRAIDDRDHANAPRVIMVNETLARRLWRDEGAVGRQLVVDYSTAGTYPYEVIGVVGDIRFGGPRSEPPPEIYFPHAQRSYLILNVVIKTSNDPRALIPLVRTAMAAVDPQKPAQGLYLLDDLVEATYARERQATVTLILFAGTAVFLAVLGVYGVLAQRVRERAREIAIRMAMGANSSRLVGWVAGTGLKLIASGIVAGLFLAWFLGGAIQGLLFGVSSTDTLTALVVVGLLTIVGLLATLLPSWRATRIDPVEILRRG
jgi:putative ABC transport system permease protein